MLCTTWTRCLTLGCLCLMVGSTAAQPPDHARRGKRGKPPEIGTQVADFTLKDIKGNDVSLSDFRDKIFVLELGACT